MSRLDVKKAARGLYPPAAFENELTTHSSTGGAQQLRALGMLKEVALAEQQFGRDPTTKPQAAAHEAGHVIVAHAAGALVTGARIFEEADRGRRVWVVVAGRKLTINRGEFRLKFDQGV